MKPQYNLDDIKYSTNQATYRRAVDLYESGKIKDFKQTDFEYTATVQGTKLYQVAVQVNKYDFGDCDCYLGQQDVLCKHMVALAIYAIFRGKKIPPEEKQVIYHPRCSNKLGELIADDLKDIKRQINHANRFIKYYNGPSRIWFAYQNSLQEGVNRLSTIVSKLPISYQTADLLVKTLLKIDKKLSSGIDDSNGIVGGFIVEAVDVLREYAETDPSCTRSFKQLLDQPTAFGWEEPLVNIYQES